MNIGIIIASIVISAVIFFFIGVAYRKKIAESKIQSAEEEAKKIEPEDVKEVKAQKVNIEKGNTTKVSLKVLIAFTDKYTKKDYEVNDVLKVDKARAEELLSDARGLVSKV